MFIFDSGKKYCPSQLLPIEWTVYNYDNIYCYSLLHFNSCKHYIHQYKLLCHDGKIITRMGFSFSFFFKISR